MGRWLDRLKENSSESVGQGTDKADNVENTYSQMIEEFNDCMNEIAAGSSPEEYERIREHSSEEKAFDGIFKAMKEVLDGRSGIESFRGALEGYKRVYEGAQREIETLDT